jgi:hypothetical protein
MRPLRYSINIILGGCCDHRAMFADEELHRDAAENIAQADGLLYVPAFASPCGDRLSRQISLARRLPCIFGYARV